MRLWIRALSSSRISKRIFRRRPLPCSIKAMSFSMASIRNWMSCATSVRMGRIISLLCNRVRQNVQGISSLKVGFNNVFGYYLEVTHTHKDKVPEEWTRKQTLTNAERYITPELKEYEEKILNAENRISVLEEKLYFELVERIEAFVVPIQRNAKIYRKTGLLVGLCESRLESGLYLPNNRRWLCDRYQRWSASGDRKAIALGRRVRAERCLSRLGIATDHDHYRSEYVR